MAAACLAWALGVTSFAAASDAVALELQTLAGALKIEPWGANSLRVRAVTGGGTTTVQELPGALIKPGSDNKGASLAGDGAVDAPVVRNSSITNGNIAATVGDDGLVRVTRVSDGTVILHEISRKTVQNASLDGNPRYSQTSVVFAAKKTDKVFGMGEHLHGQLDNKNVEQVAYRHPPKGPVMLKDWHNVSYDFEQCTVYRGGASQNGLGGNGGGSVCIPWIITATQHQTDKSFDLSYGFLWNMPNYGTVSFWDTNTTWMAEATSQVDYFVTVPPHGSKPFEAGPALMHAYVDAVGHAPVLPDWASGYWHSRNRYSSQKMLLAAAKGFHDRGVNVSVIVIDYMHWIHMGDFSFDPKSWPDVPGMMKTLEEYGMRVMVSAWPFLSKSSSTRATVVNNHWAMTVQGTSTPVGWDDNNCVESGGGPCAIYDPTQKPAREYIWSRLKDGYYKYGIKVFWLDGSEPEISTQGAYAASKYYNNSLGFGQQNGMMYPYFHTRTIHDGLTGEGESDVVMLTRSAWAGMQRWGAALWSGDTASSWADLKVSVQAGLNTQMSGIAWWTTDIGGYGGGKPEDPEFRELIVRWFQYGATCPLFRQHGSRPTEIWLLGNVSEAAIEKVIALRNDMQPYIMQQMEDVSKTGQPINRPLWWDFPDDPHTWEIDDSYMFGGDFLMAPVTDMGARNKTTYLPSGATYRHYFTNRSYAGGQNVTVDAPLDQFPLFHVLKTLKPTESVSS